MGWTHDGGLQNPRCIPHLSCFLPSLWHTKTPALSLFYPYLLLSTPNQPPPETHHHLLQFSLLPPKPITKNLNHPPKPNPQNEPNPLSIPEQKKARENGYHTMISTTPSPPRSPFPPSAPYELYIQHGGLFSSAEEIDGEGGRELGR